MRIPSLQRLDFMGFTTALHQGRGSACLHVRQHASDELFDIILDACLHNRAFDPQCEGPRTDWLHSLIADDDMLCAAVIQAFEDPVEEQDCFQVANLVGLIARSGNPTAAAALRRLWAENDLAGEVAIIALDGLPAALEVVGRLGQRLLAQPNEYIDSLDFLIEDEALRGQVLSELRVLAPGDAGIAGYLDQHQQRADQQADEDALTSEQQEQRKLQYVRDFIASNPASRIIELARQPDNVGRFLFRRFGRLAPDSERQAILQALAAETESRALSRLPGVFRSEGLRDWNDTVWRLVHSEDEKVRLAATRAMLSLQDSRLGELARLRIADDDFSAERRDEIELFANNYLPGDERLIIKALKRVKTDADGMHGIGMAALRVCEANPDIRLAEVAVFIYQTNPCTLCRRDIVAWMKDLDCLPDWIANECQFDASAETRALM